MPGGLMQLVAYGAQDEFLTNNQQITLFRTTYRRHFNQTDNDTINIIYYQKYEGIEEITCPISNEITINPVKTICNHIFDKEMLEQWLQQHNNCPLCRAHLCIMD